VRRSWVAAISELIYVSAMYVAYGGAMRGCVQQRRAFFLGCLGGGPAVFVWSMGRRCPSGTREQSSSETEVADCMQTRYANLCASASATRCDLVRFGARFRERLPANSFPCNRGHRFQDRRIRPLCHPSGV